MCCWQHSHYYSTMVRRSNGTTASSLHGKKKGGVVFRTIAKKHKKDTSPSISSKLDRVRERNDTGESFHIVASHNSKKEEADVDEKLKKRKKGDLVSSSSSSSSSRTTGRVRAPKVAKFDHNFLNNQAASVVLRDRSVMKNPALRATRQGADRTNRTADSNVPKPRVSTRLTLQTNSNSNKTSSSSSNNNKTADGQKRENLPKKHNRFTAFDDEVSPFVPNHGSSPLSRISSLVPQFEVWKEMICISTADLKLDAIEDMRTENYNIFRSTVSDLKNISQAADSNSSSHDNISGDFVFKNDFQTFDDWITIGTLGINTRKRGDDDSTTNENNDNDENIDDSKDDEVTIDDIVSSLGGTDSLLKECAQQSLWNFTQLIRLERIVEATKNIDRLHSRRDQVMKALFGALRDNKFSYTTGGNGNRYPFRQKPLSIANCHNGDNGTSAVSNNGSNDDDDDNDDDHECKYTTRRVTGALALSQKAFPEDMIVTVPKRIVHADPVPPKSRSLLGACLTKHVAHGSFVQGLQTGHVVEFMRVSQCWEVGVVLKIMRDVPSCGSTLFSSFPIIRHVKIASVTAAGASVLDSCIVQVEDGRIAPLGTNISDMAVALLVGAQTCT